MLLAAAVLGLAVAVLAGRTGARSGAVDRAGSAGRRIRSAAVRPAALSIAFAASPLPEYPRFVPLPPEPQGSFCTMGVLGEMFPRRKIANEAGEAGDAQPWRLGPIELDRGVVQVHRAAPPIAADPADAERADVERD